MKQSREVATMSWRPNEWRNPYKHSNAVQARDIPEGYVDVSDEEWEAFEAGADAMLVACEAHQIAIRELVDKMLERKMLRMEKKP